MSDLQQYKNKRMKKDPKFWKDYEKRLETFKLGVLLKQARIEAGLTQEQIARQLRTTKSGSEEHTSELQSRGLISYAVFCLKKKM